MDAGLYIHIPFCLKKCPYCDFYSITDTSLHPAFMDALVSEMRITRYPSLTFDTLYMGGGTPSVLDAKTIGKIIGTARESYEILPHAEITLEVNPGTVSLKKFEGCQHAGVNRINIGVQSFDPVNLHFLGRIHSARDAHVAVNWAQKAGFENIGLDLIYGIPNQTKKSWLMDLKLAVESEPQHLSCYILSFEPGTPLYRDRQEGRLKPLAEPQVCELFETTLEFLSDHGYVQYEISNFARGSVGSFGLKGAELNRSRHNMKYWKFAPYIGLGPSAHSFLEPKRYWNCADVEKYIQDLDAEKLPLAGEEQLSMEQFRIEAIYLGLRQTKGILIDVFDKKFGLNFKTMFEEIIAVLEARGLIELSQRRCALTSKGMLYIDTVASLFI
ncbi:MAG: radical SAM family heme chaperone HemW [Thermodesulfobacteriota bacterium]|nr:radical SAM family heme chaperone HemW [Thermodesulfobacteriota bacterium]